MFEENEQKPGETPAQEAQPKPIKPAVTIPLKPRPELIDILTEGVEPDIEKKKDKK
jgi:hypothetical protein